MRWGRKGLNVTFRAKMAMTDLQRYPSNLYLIKNGGFRFSDSKSIFWLIISPLLVINKKCASSFRIETRNVNKQERTWRY